ncbi:11125_t:CDS:2, partial [Funneliformis geosporum]
VVKVVNDSSSKEESKKKLLDAFREEIKDLRDTTVDLFLADLIIKAEKAIGEIQSQSRRRTEAAKREKYRELVSLMKQIDLYEKDKDIKKRKSDQEFSDTPNLLESYLNPEQKDYVDDHRRTIISAQSHSIAERQLIPHEERIILLSRSENKKENKVNNYLTVHHLSALEPTNIPSQGKELKTRGDNWVLIKLDRQYFTRSQKGELKPTLRSTEFFTAALPVPEEFTDQFLLIITQKGKIKLIAKEKLQNISKSGKKLINLYQKTIEKCSLHQTQLVEHKAISHVCGIGCSPRRELQKKIKECGNEEIEVVFKRKGKDGQAKNLKTSIYRQMRQRDEEGKSIYCPTHQTKLKGHKSQPKIELVPTVNQKRRLTEKETMEEKVLKSTLPPEVKEKVLKDIKIITGLNTKEMTRKIANSPVDATISQEAIKSLTKDLKQKGEVYQKLLNEVKNQQDKIGIFKEKSKRCKDCQKYCAKHEKESQQVNAEHETCNHCHKYDKQIQQSKEKVEEIKGKLENLRKKKPGASKEIQKLVNELAKKMKQGEKIRYEALGNRTKCPILNKIKAERKACSKCREQEKKKHLAQLENPLHQVCLVDKEKNLEIYLLADTDILMKKQQESQAGYNALQEKLKKLENDYSATKEKLRMCGYKDSSENGD